MKRQVGTVATVVLLGFLAGGARAACRLELEQVASGLVRPVGIACPDDGSRRMFVLEQHSGRIKILDLRTGALVGTLLDLDNLATGNEQGLLGMAFDPDYAENGLFYLNVTVAGGATQIQRHRTLPEDPNRTDPRQMEVMLSYSQPYSNHNGGWLGFGPDGYLYITAGDGGSGFDPGNRAQSLSTLLGKMLRIDAHGTDGSTGRYGIPATNPFVNSPAAQPEIWAYGLRNPWRCSFDRLTGNLYIADVGQNQIEEIDFQPAASPGGENYGWRVMEGTRCSDNSQAGGNPPCGDPRLVAPIYEYTHAVGVSVTGGYVYRGAALRGWQGMYFFADYGRARIWSFRFDGTEMTEFAERTAELDPEPRRIGLISSFGEDPEGELYLLDMANGDVYRIAAPQAPAAGDLDDDCDVDFADLAILAENWMAGRR